MTEILARQFVGVHELRKNLEGALRLVFITTDPERDTPARLQDYTQESSKATISHTVQTSSVRPAAIAGVVAVLMATPVMRSVLRISLW